MKKTARNNSHATSACVHCRQRKTRCDGEKPACGTCVRKGEECEYTPDRDRRTARGRACTRCADLEAENAQLRAQLAVFKKSAAPAPTDKPLTVVHASSTAPFLKARLDVDDQLFFPSEPFNLFPLAEAQTPEFHPPEQPPAPGQATIEPRWLQESSFLTAVHSEFDQLQPCTQPAFPATPPHVADADLESSWTASKAHP